MILPVIHTNGTSGEELARLYGDARRAALHAINAAQAAAPNGRDFYPLGDNAHAAAMREHCQRVEKLRSVHDDLLALEEHCHAINAETARRRAEWTR